MGLNKTIETIFKENLATAKADFPNEDLHEHVNIAMEWTEERLSQIVRGIGDSYYWQHQEMINKAFFG